MIDAYRSPSAYSAADLGRLEWQTSRCRRGSPCSEASRSRIQNQPMFRLVDDVPSVISEEDATTETRCASIPSPSSVYMLIDSRSNETETCMNSTALDPSPFCLDRSIDSSRSFFDSSDHSPPPPTPPEGVSGMSLSNNESPEPLDSISKSWYDSSSFTPPRIVGPPSSATDASVPRRVCKLDAHIAVTLRILVTWLGARRSTIPGRTPTTHVLGVLSPEEIVCSKPISKVNDIGSMTLLAPLPAPEGSVSSGSFLDASPTELTVKERSFISSLR
mmetsp:Transcript_14666/g.31905  ORF Transcript_14666/g.31905 Transcript_14666/m.31905 type:complete len:275 (-) Transcript_14666:1030-1854(-)